MHRFVVLLVICGLLVGCGASPTPPISHPGLWGNVAVVEFTGFVPLRSLDWNGTGELFLIAVLDDARGSLLMCTNDHTTLVNKNKIPEHVPVSVDVNQPVGLRCNGAAQVRPDQSYNLTFSVFEVDDYGILVDLVDIVFDAVSALKRIPKLDPKVSVAIWIANYIKNELESRGWFNSTDLVGTYVRQITEPVDFTQSGDVDEGETLRVHYRTSRVVNLEVEKLPPNTGTIDQPMPYPADKSALVADLVYKNYYVCQRAENKRSCNQNGGLYLRVEPCAINDLHMSEGGNILATLRNGTHITRVRDEIVLSQCPNNADDDVRSWMYVQTEDGREGFVSTRMLYLTTDRDQ